MFKEELLKSFNIQKININTYSLSNNNLQLVYHHI